MTHPSFARASTLTDEHLRAHFPKSVEEARAFEPLRHVRALSSRVLAVAQTRVECTWRAYIDAVPGQRHEYEWQAVAAHGATLPEEIARFLFPEFKEVPYAD